MTSHFELRFNDRDNWEEHDWLVLEHGSVVQGFATSTAAERWIVDRERQARIDRCVSKAERRRLDRIIPFSID